MKTCTKCNLDKDETKEFRLRRNGRYRSECKKCEYQQKKYLQEAKKNAGKQPIECQCCGKTDDALICDHCHVSGKFRGWLCHNCNAGIGKLGDNLEGVLDALFYLVQRKTT